MDGSQTTAMLDAPDVQTLHEQLHGEGRRLIRAKELRARGGKRELATATAHGTTRLGPSRLLGFTQSMEGALDAGVPVLQALDAIIEQEHDIRAKALFQDISSQVSGGKPLSEALASHPRSFPSVYCAMVRAGESSGRLPIVLESIASWQEWRIEITGTIRQAMTYPAIVIGAGYCLVFFMLAFVLPSLADVLVKLGGDLPLASRVLFDASRFVSGHVLPLLGATASLVVTLFVAARSDGGRSALVSFLTFAPITRRVVTTIAVSQFCRNLSVLLSSGLTVTHALELSRSAISTRSTREAIDRAVQRIVGGHKLTESLAETRFLPPIAISMIRVGEESGRLPESFDRLNRVYDREVKATVKRALSLLEPIVTVVLGVV
ncbi:MAG: type II secretion system F family protein, partial [Planctomycetes bacterium]|nr:type II secretion system F family protein [Planctomycetota bacterium]